MASAPSSPVIGRYTTAIINEYAAGNIDAKSLTFMLTHPFPHTYLYILSLLLNTIYDQF